MKQSESLVQFLLLQNTFTMCVCVTSTEQVETATHINKMKNLAKSRPCFGHSSTLSHLFCLQTALKKIPLLSYEGRKEGGGDEKNTPGEIPRPSNRKTKRVFSPLVRRGLGKKFFFRMFRLECRLKHGSLILQQFRMGGEQVFTSLQV